MKIRNISNFLFFILKPKTMKRHLSLLFLFTFLLFSLYGQIISQYIETSSGSTPKGIEIWNNTDTELNFNSNNLVIEKGTNGAIPSVDFSITSGKLSPWEVLVAGTSDLQTITENNGSSFFLKAFTFNGDDALVIKFGGIVTDVFGNPGSDPGTAWSGNGVSTANQNIALLDGVETGDINGWTDPSQRFETISTDNSAVGFGIAPVHITGTLQVQPIVLNEFSYVLQLGPSNSQLFTLSGTGLYNDVEVTPPSDFEISTDNVLFQSSAITLPHSSGTLPQTTIFVRLKEGLDVGRYFNEILSVTSVGAIEKTVICNGRVNYSAEMRLPNAWINEFHYDNISTDIDEFIEIVIENASLFDMADFSVSLYNGGDGKVYGSETVNHFTFGSTNNGFSFYTWYPGSLQNGPDGFSINYKEEAILLLSYEGSFTATDGPATGMISYDTGIAQSNTKTLIGHSLQLVETGNRYSHFRWVDSPASPGIINNHQNFGEPMPPVPVDYRIILLVFILIALRIIYKRI
jgi:hypothetical protein